MVDVPHVGEWKYSFRYRGRATSIHCLFLMKAIVSTITPWLCQCLSLLHISGDYLLRMQRAAGVLRGQGGESGLRKRSGLQHGPPHIITIYFLESVRGGRAISSPSPVSLFSADARRAIRFRLSTVYSITVPHVSEIARQRVSPLVSGVRAGLSGLRRVRVVSVPPFPLELAKRNIFARSIDRNPEQNDEGGAFPLVRRASSSDMTCYSAVHLLHFYVSKSLHSYAGGVRNTADLILIEG